MKTTLWLSMIIALRFLGLFIVLPMLAVYASEQAGSTPFLIGLAVGGYAITQIFFQYPLGKLSDKIGRKKIIVIGLLIFLVGSIVCAMSDNIYMLVAGRLLQGAGAISSAITAMISDFTRESERAKAMAVMGGSIAMSFIVSMVAGPMIGGYFGIEILFEITAVLAIGAILIMLFKIPQDNKIEHEFENESNLMNIIKNKELFRMNVTMFFHSATMTVAFLVIPLTLISSFAWQKSELWMAYLPSIAAGFIFMGIAAILGEKHDKTKQVFIASIILSIVSFAMFAMANSASYFIAGMVVFFIGFMMLEPLLQSTTTKIAKIHERGAALGVFNTVQFLGVFVGGLFGGYLLESSNIVKLGFIMSAVSVFWLFWVIGMKNPLRAKFLFLNLNEVSSKYKELLKNKNGVVDFYRNATENTLIIKLDPSKCDEKEVESYLKTK